MLIGEEVIDQADAECARATKSAATGGNVREAGDFQIFGAFANPKTFPDE